MTKIPWTDKSWNPVVGCTKIATGCKNCYAERMAKRLYHMGMASPWKNPEYMKFEDGWKYEHIELCEHRLEQPLHWRKPRKIFVCSMSDLFHPKVPFNFIDRVFCTMLYCKQHTFQVLTKRIERVVKYIESGHPKAWWPMPNCWIGTSISTQADLERAWWPMKTIPTSVRFISLEPMLERVNFGQVFLKSIDWVIIGCESGPKARLCSIDDIRYVVEQCKEVGVTCFVKQIPINGKCSKKPEEWPPDLRVQEYPR